MLDQLLEPGLYVAHISLAASVPRMPATGAAVVASDVVDVRRVPTRLAV